MTNFLFRHFCRRNIRDRPDKLQFARIIFDGMGHHVEMFNGIIWKQQPMFKIQVYSVARGALDGLLHIGKIFRMDPVEHEL